MRPPWTTVDGIGSPRADQASDTAPAGVPSRTPAGAEVVLSVAAASEPRHSRVATTSSATVAAVQRTTRRGGRTGDGLRSSPFSGGGLGAAAAVGAAAT